VYAKTGEGKTILDTAIETGNQEIMQLVKQAMEIPWSPQRHYLYPPEVRKRISTVMCLRMKSTQLDRLPKDLLFIICKYIAERSRYTHTEYCEPVCKKQKRNVIK